MTSRWQHRDNYSHDMRRRALQRLSREERPRVPHSPPPLGPEFESISIADLSVDASRPTDDIRITECKGIASYNWLDRWNPSILIPGAPARWAPPRETIQLKGDSGTYYRNKNASRYPNHPLEPAVEAIMQLNPVNETKLGPIDVVACGNTLRNLLRFVKGDGQPFRMLVEVVGTTVHLIRRENSPRETIPNVHGYGHRFLETYTAWDPDVRESTSHQRILHYQFAGLGCLVRFEADGYLPDKVGDIPGKQTEGDATSLEAVAAKLATAGVSRLAPRRAANSLRLTISPGGRLIPHEAVLDVKTRSAKKDAEEVMSEELPRFWLGQLPNFVLARHVFGVFSDVEIKDIREDVKIWESTNSELLSRFASLLHGIVDVARGRKDSKMEIVREEDQDRLRLLGQLPQVPAAFSVNVALRWENWLSGMRDQASGSNQGSEATDSDEDWVEGEGDLTSCSEECDYCGRCNSRLVSEPQTTRYII